MAEAAGPFSITLAQRKNEINEDLFIAKGLWPTRSRDWHVQLSNSLLILQSNYTGDVISFERYLIRNQNWETKSSILVMQVPWKCGKLANIPNVWEFLKRIFFQFKTVQGGAGKILNWKGSSLPAPNRRLEFPTWTQNRYDFMNLSKLNSDLFCEFIIRYLLHSLDKFWLLICC